MIKRSRVARDILGKKSKKPRVKVKIKIKGDAAQVISAVKKLAKSGTKAK